MPKRRLSRLGRCLLLVACGALLPARPFADALAEVASEARTPGEVYERRRTLAESLLYVARDLRTRATSPAEAGPAHLLLVVDPTPSLRDELEVMAETVDAVFAAGPQGLRVGVLGVGGADMEPHPEPAAASGALLRYTFLPVPGPKNLLAGVREGARMLRGVRGRPRSLLLVTQEGGEAEDDVEATREALLDADTAFYAFASEAAFERSWLQTFVPREVPAAGLGERFHPEPPRRRRGALYYGGETAFGLVPYRWEFDLAQSEFVWVRPPRYPVPSGFGYWPLASLAFSTGGRYFVHDFSRSAHGAAGGGARGRRALRYDYGRLNFCAPDLRPRHRVLKDLAKDVRARTIVRIWQHLADEACPVIQTLGTLETRGGSLGMRPARPLRSASRPIGELRDMREVRKALGFVQRRLDALHPCLQWWSAANAKPRPTASVRDPSAERVEADFQLLGVQLQRVQFQWREALAALKRIKPLHVSYRRVRLRPVVLATGLRRHERAADLGDAERSAAFAELWAALHRLGTRYRGTPWALVLEKGRIVSFELDIQVVEPEPERRPPEPRRAGASGAAGKQAPKPSPPKRAPPPPGPRPGSTTDAPATGGR